MNKYFEKYRLEMWDMTKNIIEIAFQVILILIIGTILSKLIIKTTKKLLEKGQVDIALHPFILNGTKIIFWTMIMMTVFATLGIPITSFLTVLGAAGLAVALALKDSLGNIAGGIIIIVTKPFNKGDYIDITETSGIVESIDLLYTTLKTFDNKVVSVPNGKITTSVLVNFTRESVRRVDLKLGVGYGDNIEKVKEVLYNVAESDERILLDPPPFAGVSGHGDSAVNIDFKIWTDTENYWDVYYDMHEMIKNAFDENNISIPYPQIDVHNIKEGKLF